MVQANASIAQEEVARFSAMAGEWWDPKGAFRILHQMNPLRAAYVKDQACSCFKRKPKSAKALQGLKVLDAGCGGGLLAESLARLGATVTGFDASPKAVALAKRHAVDSGLAIDYRTGSVEDLAKGKARFDIVTAFEIIEHVADLDSFLKALAKLLKPGGLLVIATLNRTRSSFLFGVLASEYVLGWVPRGTHDWEKFVRPSELVRRLEVHNITTCDLTGVTLNPLTGEFGLKKGDLRINYLLAAIKK